MGDVIIDVENIDINSLLEVLASTAYISYTNCLFGSCPEFLHKYYERISNPEIGDLVLEISSVKRVPAINRIGELISIKPEPYPDWEDEDEPAPERNIWTIKCLDKNIFRWENCSFISIPEDSFKPFGLSK